MIEIDRLKDQIEELKKENMQLREIIVTPIKIEKVEIVESPYVIAKEEKPHVTSKNIVIDDTIHAKEAETYEEPINVVVENTEKVVVLNQEKSRKEYQQEYQRQYRKQKKEQQNK